MNAQPIYDGGPLFPAAQRASGGEAENPGNFSTLLDTKLSGDKTASGTPALNSIPAPIRSYFDNFPEFIAPQPSALSRNKLAEAYGRQAGTEQQTSKQTDWQKYKDDQLLRNPGGDYYHLEERRVSKDSGERKSFLSRVGKDLSDFFGNVKNFFGNLFMGSKFHYRDENNEIKEATQRGLLGTCVDFVKDVGSALTFGLWHPGEEKGPQGIGERVSHFGSRLKKAFLGDLVEGVPKSVNHMAKNLVLAGLNLAQVVPDATIGNAEAGRKLTTTLFDNGQVMVEYLTDIIPSGDAWFRVHAMNLQGFKAPVLYNLELPEHAKGDARWQYVRNTPFRKTIETIGTLLADIATFGLAGQSCFSTNQQSDQQKLLKSMIR
jgi:hypothetical protein